MTVLVNVAKTFGTYCVADTLSNFIQHPTQKMDYGIFNKYLDRPVDQQFWGTRTEHIIGVAAALAVTDHTSQAICSKYLGQSLCFTRSPATFVAHTFFFIFTGVTAYVAADAAFNPLIKEEKKMDAFASGTYSSAIGSCTAWFEPYVAPVLAKIAGPAVAGSWLGSSLLPATLAYSTVKDFGTVEILILLIHMSIALGVGWNDWGDAGLSDHEKAMTYPAQCIMVKK